MVVADRTQAMASRVTRGAGGLAVLLGAGTLALRFDHWHRVNVPAFSSGVLLALAILAGGGGLILLNLRRHQAFAVQTLALIDVLLALAMLLIDGLRDTPLATNRPPLAAIANAPAAALCILFHGLALLLASRPVGRTWRSPAIATLGSTILALALVSLLAHGLDAHGHPWLTPRLDLYAFAAVGLLTLGIGLIGLATVLAPPHRSRRAPWLPASIGIGLTIFTLVVWRELARFERLHTEQIVASAAIAIRTHIATNLRAEIDRGERMARRWEKSGGTPRELWEADAAGYIGDLPSLEEILWLDQDLIPRWGIPFAADDPRWAADAASPRLSPFLAAARDERRPTLSPSFLSPDRKLNFLISLPLYIDDRFDGLLVTVISVPGFLQGVLNDSVQQDYVTTVSDSGRIVYGPGPATQEPGDLASGPLHLALDGLNWQLNVRPLPGSPAGARSTLPEATLIVGLILAGLVMLSVRLGQMATERARELEALNAALERRVAARTADLQRAITDVKRSNEELEQFAYVASHDLQEPLRMVSSYVQLLARRYKGRLDPDADDFIGYAVDGAERMKRLINDLLAYSRLGTHGKPFRLVDMHAIFHQTLRNLEFAIRDAAAEVTAAPLPAVHGDETQLLQLLQNLIGNAIKFRGQDAPRVQLAATREDAHWHFTVQDNGIGIDPQYAERIFIIFRRLHAHAEYAGTGIGLAVCKKIVERHGGRIWVTSLPGQGSTFHFLLPAEPAAPAITAE